MGRNWRDTYRDKVSDLDCLSDEHKSVIYDILNDVEDRVKTIGEQMTDWSFKEAKESIVELIEKLY